MCTKLIVTFVSAVILLMALAAAQPDSNVQPAVNTTRAPPVSTRAPRPPITRGPAICRPSTVCTVKSPNVCGRNRRGQCRRFGNVCQLGSANCALPGRRNVWTHTSLNRCAGLRVGAMAICRTVCPRAPVKCPKGGPSLCVCNQDRNICTVVANRCALQNLNCRTQHKQHWTIVKRSQCPRRSRNN